MKVILYANRTYRGGHYFGKIPLHRKSELRRALKAGTHPARNGNSTLTILNRDSKPYLVGSGWGEGALHISHPLQGG